MLTTGAPNILIRANIYNNDTIRYIVLVVSCFVLPIPNIYRDTSVSIPSLGAPLPKPLAVVKWYRINAYWYKPDPPGLGEW